MTRQHSPKVREDGQHRVKVLTNLAIGATILATGSLAAFVAHEYGSKAHSTPTSTVTTNDGGFQVPATSGTSGTTGTSGTSGTSGTTGTSGTSGTSGAAQAPSQIQQAPTPTPQPQASSGGS